MKKDLPVLPHHFQFLAASLVAKEGDKWGRNTTLKGEGKKARVFSKINCIAQCLSTARGRPPNSMGKPGIGWVGSCPREQLLLPVAWARDLLTSIAGLIDSSLLFPRCWLEPAWRSLRDSTDLQLYQGGEQGFLLFFILFYFFTRFFPLPWPSFLRRLSASACNQLMKPQVAQS